MKYGYLFLIINSILVGFFIYLYSAVQCASQASVKTKILLKVPPSDTVHVSGSVMAAGWEKRMKEKIKWHDEP